MSKTYSTSNQSFFQNQSRVRKMIQTQIQQFFCCIKEEIEDKIKSMDKSIREMKSEMSVLVENQNYCIQKMQQILDKERKGDKGQVQGRNGWQKKCQENQNVIKELLLKVEAIEKQRDKDISRIWQELRGKGNQRRQQKSPLFRKSNGPNIDLNNIIFGEENFKNNSNSQFIKQKVQPEQKQTPLIKPPLPKPRIPEQKQQKQVKKPHYSPTQPSQQIQILDPQTRAYHQEQLPKQKQVALNPYKSNSNYIQSSKTPEQIQNVPSKVIENLNKNKNSFMRKKSLKKFSTIIEEDVEQSMLSTQ